MEKLAVEGCQAWTICCQNTRLAIGNKKTIAKTIAEDTRQTKIDVLALMSPDHQSFVLFVVNGGSKLQYKYTALKAPEWRESEMGGHCFCVGHSHALRMLERSVHKQKRSDRGSNTGP